MPGRTDSRCAESALLFGPCSCSSAIRLVVSIASRSPISSSGDTPQGLERARVFHALRSKLFGAAPEPVSVDRFEIKRRLGEGATGIVYAAFDPQLQREVALKLFNAVSEQKREAFLHEARALARFAHPNVLQIYEVGMFQGAPYLISELVDGGTLRQWILAEPRTTQAIVDLLCEAASGLVVAHQRGITHRDIKPENLLVGSDGRPRISDFGLALSPNRGPGEVVANAVAGTPRYMAPEQLRGEGVEPASDQFSFCVMWFEALFGRLPFEGATHDEMLAAIESGSIATLDAGHPAARWLAPLRRGLNARPGSRYPSMAELIAAMRVAAKPASSRGLAGLRLAAVASLVVVAAFGVYELALSRVTRDDHPAAPRSTASLPAASHGVVVAIDSPASSTRAFDPRLSPNHGARICVAVCLETVHAAREKYLSWANDPNGPTGSERKIRGVQEVSSQCESCKKYLRINPLTPSLESAAGPLFAAIDELLPVAIEAERYYDRGLYKSDAMATGRRLHAPLLSGYSNVSKAGRAFRDAAEQIEIAEQTRLVAPLYLPARALLNAGGREFSTIDVRALERAVVDFESALATLPPDDNDVHARAKSLAISARDLLQKRRSPDPFSSRQQSEIGTFLGHTVHGSPDQLIAAYDHLGSSLDWLAPCRHYRSQPIELSLSSRARV